jgi:aminopeptidase N
MRGSNVEDLLSERSLCAGGSTRPFFLPTSSPHYVPDRPFELHHIKLEVRPDFGKEIIDGTAYLRLKAKRNGVRTVALNIRDLNVVSVKLRRGKELRFSQEGDYLLVEMPSASKRGEDYELRVKYHGHPRKGLYFRKPDVEQPSRPTQLWTQGEDEDSRYWFPCIDTPAQKLTSEVIATVPPGMTAISNGRLVGVKKLSSGMSTYHWLQDKPHSVYLISLVVGEYVELRDKAGEVPLYYYVYKGREEDAKRSFSETPRMLKFFEEKTGYKYPWAKYSQVVVNEFIFGGMENTSATTLTDTTLHDERAHLDFSSVHLVAHELAHMWFGDLLTCKHWKHGWLNESFATYFQLLYTEQSRGKDEFLMELLKDLEEYLEEYNKHYARPIVTHTYETASELFDRHLYEKGSLVLHMLRAKLGDDDFFRSIGRYVVDNAFSSVETAHLAAAVEETTGMNVDEFFDQWLYRPGHPSLQVTYIQNSSGPPTIRVRQKQEEPAFKFDLTLKAQYKSGATYHTLKVEEKDQLFSVPLEKGLMYLSVDPNFQLLATVDFERPREMVLVQLRDDTTYGRIQAAKALGKDASLQAVGALKDCLLSDSFWGVRAEAARALGEIGTDGAMSVLLEGLKVEHPKARRAVVQALGRFRKPDASAALVRHLKGGDPSYYVEAEAARSLGKTKQREGYEMLVECLGRPSHNEVIQSAALDGLAYLQDERALPLVVERTSKKFHFDVRRSATAALGKLGEGRSETRDLLLSLLKDSWFRVRMAAAEALVERRDISAIGDIESAASSELDGRVRRIFRESVNSLHDMQPTSAELKSMREEIEKMKEEGRELREKVDLLQRELQLARGGGRAGLKDLL